MQSTQRLVGAGVRNPPRKSSIPVRANNKIHLLVLKAHDYHFISQKCVSVYVCVCVWVDVCVYVCVCVVVVVVGGEIPGRGLKE